LPVLQSVDSPEQSQGHGSAPEPQADACDQETRKMIPAPAHDVWMWKQALLDNNPAVSILARDRSTPNHLQKRSQKFWPPQFQKRKKQKMQLDAASNS